MAKSAFTIQMDYNKTIKKAEELEAVARDLRNLANSSFESSISRLKSNWTGEAANAYIAKANKVKSELLASASNIQKSATTLKSIAVRTYKAEMANLAILNKG